MVTRAYSPLERVRRTRRVQRLALLCAGSVAAALSLYRYRLETEKAKVSAIVQHALGYCAAFETQCEPEGEPRFCRESGPLPGVKQMERPWWYVPLRANGQHYALILRADTGRLCYVFNTSPWEGSAKRPLTNNALQADSNRAVSQSLRYLQRLKVVYGDAQIALDSRPDSVRSDTGWRVVWNVRESRDVPAEALRVTISQQGGKLLQFANTAAMNQTAL